ncbi:MAG TPA: hypothetical protein VJK26_00740 [Patescibacteria group bacterium]|nr:hypothetical protein [Patescibacteria group bacterium]
MKKSFTLIELMVVIGIVVLLTAGSVAGISASRTRKQARDSAERIKSFLTDARSRAMAPRDSDFNMKYIQVRIYPFDSTVEANRNKIFLYKLNRDNPIGEDTSDVRIDEQVVSRGAFLDADIYSSPGLLKECVTPCVQTRTKDSNLVYFYYNYKMTGLLLGQIQPATSGPESNVTLRTDNDNAFQNDYYQINLDGASGMIRICPVESVTPPRVGECY